MPKLGPCLALLLLSATGCGLIMSAEDQAKVATACAGQAVEGAKAHERGPDGFMVYVQGAADGDYAWSVDGVHYKLRNTAKLAEVNTVFCLDAPVEVPDGFCAFDSTEGIGVAGMQVIETSRTKGPTFARVGVKRSARLVDPATGNTLAEHTINTAAPKCDEYIGDPSEASFRASAPSPIGFADWATAELGVKK